MPPVLKLVSPEGLKLAPTVSLLRAFVTKESKDGKLPPEIAVQNGHYAEIRDACLAVDVGFVNEEFPIKFNFREPWMNGGEVIISEAPIDE